MSVCFFPTKQRTCINIKFSFPYICLLSYVSMRAGIRMEVKSLLWPTQFSGIGILGWFAIPFPAVFTLLGLNWLAIQSSQYLLGQQAAQNSCRHGGQSMVALRSTGRPTVPMRSCCVMCWWWLTSCWPGGTVCHSYCYALLNTKGVSRTSKLQLNMAYLLTQQTLWWMGSRSIRPSEVKWVWQAMTNCNAKQLSKNMGLCSWIGFPMPIIRNCD